MQQRLNNDELLLYKYERQPRGKPELSLTTKSMRVQSEMKNEKTPLVAFEIPNISLNQSTINKGVTIDDHFNSSLL